jgi:uncharacterized protein YjiS (DUF1127 family)
MEHSMESGSTIIERRLQGHAGYAFIEGVAGLVSAGWRAASERISAFAKSLRRAQARRELHELSDRQLRDIGLERRQIDRLFR